MRSSSSAALQAIFLSLLASTSHAAKAKAAKPKDAILLSEVQSLTLRAGRQTSYRRVSPIPQLRCVSSPKICALHAVDVLRCTNQGSSYGAEEVEWSCAAPLPPELKLGATDVVCEGYASPDDPYILRGSCGVEYRLVLTDAGERKFPDIAAGGSGSGSGFGWFPSSEKGDGEEGDGSGVSAWLFGIIFFGVLFWIVYSAWTQARTPPGAVRRPGNRGFGGGGGGGFDPGYGPGGGPGGGGGYWGTDDDPPPPYSGKGTSSASGQQGQAGWRPGFWTGMAGGAAAAYLAGNRGNRNQDSRGLYGGGSSSSGSSGWGSRPGPSSSSRGSDSGGGSTSTSRYTSTGFGSTSRR